MKIPWEIKMGTVAQYIAIASFILGTLLFLIRFVIKDDSLLVIGLYYVLFTVVVNLVYLVSIFVSLFFTNKYHMFLIQKGLIMLANIPIAALYFFIIIKSMDF